MADWYPVETRWQWDEVMQQKRRRMKQTGRWTTKPKLPSRQPPRGYTWPPFILGIPESVGISTEYVCEPMAGGLAGWLLSEAERPGSPIGYLVEPQFLPAIEKWANAEARRMRLEQDVALNGEFDGFGRVRPVVDVLARWEARCGYHGERLGLDPVSLSKIRRNLDLLHRQQEADQTVAELQRKYARRAASEIEVLDQEEAE